MLTHSQIWQAIDALANHHGLSPSGLAKLAGLDPTTFNKSKRAAGGKLRWPSTESVAKALTAVGATLDDFVALVSPNGGAARARMVPLIGMAQAGAHGYFDDAGFPAGVGWDEIGFPELSDEHAYALEVTGDSMLPVYRDGDHILVSPAASLRRGDRVVVKTHAGEVMAKQLGRMTAQRVELKSLNPAYEDRSFALGDLAFIHRIIWASQ
ncbi:MAG: helix-turn-helix transcriptional regulator [Alphaproteobacteria bacterium]|nr:helix-turn-helix transcriptional regulator [Alphaproteobacteria bacterium]MBU6472903.1 helix-turn-helix transcriptional regulator [Alphaproteobacteria bacterium]MDE2013233.1 helix-turn-helix transcriptional regulator [Alphaproteobacteria bacterium]MDE2074037.1 helix-turn-helix transcriptional regulator [Alphaproteobacteria bacterium]MDE2352757.1 helix-turn-helix transcriptional regulator [Alphaproteobacteria bacterium]